jgi:signal transduction histidine kinase
VGEAWSHRKAWLPDNPQATLVQVFGITGTAQGFTAAVFSHGIWRWDGRSLQRYGRAEGITEDVRQAVEPAPGELWVAGRFGILESHAAGFRRTLTLPSGFAVGLFRAPNASWYAATSAHGLFLRRNGTWVPAEELNHDLPDLNVRSMTWRRDGELWVTTLRGVSIIRDGRGRTLPPDPRTKFPGAANVALEVGDEMWVGGFGGLGIYRDGRWRVLSAADGLPGNTIYSLQRGHDGAVWAGGSAGVGRFADGRWTVWDSRSGLIEDECNMGGLWIAPDGSVLVGTMGSLARFDARLVPIPTPPLQVFWRDRPAADADGSVRQPLGQRALRLAWSAPWLLPRAVEYRTRIARLREEWSAPRASGELSIENLGPGLWEVEVEARLEGSGDAGWTQPKAARIDIARYWWETPWAVVLAIAIVPAAVIGLVRLRTQRLHRRSVELEQVVEQRTQSLVELTQRLEESNRGLQEAVQMREDLVSIVAHDIRSPLTIIQGYAELLLSRVKNQEWRDILARIGSQSVHLAALASDILTMSRIERGALELERRPLDLLQLMRSLADERFSGRVDLTLGAGLDAGPGVDGGEALAVVLGDAGAVSEVFDNLLTNAIKYSPGGTRVEVRVSRSADAAVQVAVSDRGIGIPAEDLPLLFQKFSRLDGARQRGIPGSGLGLYICRWIVEAHGGRIEVESQPGVGSTFSVTLPLASAAPAPDQNGGRSSSRS